MCRHWNAIALPFFLFSTVNNWSEWICFLFVASFGWKWCFIFYIRISVVLKLQQIISFCCLRLTMSRNSIHFAQLVQTMWHVKPALKWNVTMAARRVYRISGMCQTKPVSECMRINGINELSGNFSEVLLHCCTEWLSSHGRQQMCWESGMDNGYWWPSSKRHNVLNTHTDSIESRWSLPSRNNERTETRWQIIVRSAVAVVTVVWRTRTLLQLRYLACIMYKGAWRIFFLSKKEWKGLLNILKVISMLHSKHLNWIDCWWAKRTWARWQNHFSPAWAFFSNFRGILEFVFLGNFRFILEYCFLGNFHENRLATDFSDFPIRISLVFAFNLICMEFDYRLSWIN